MKMTSEREAKQAYRFPPCPAYDIEGTESWLADMAAKGLTLSADGFFAGFAIFDQTEPHHARYRLEALPKAVTWLSANGGAPDDEAKELVAAYGWKYITTRGQFYIYCAEAPDSRELNTDPKVQALALDMVRKRERTSMIISLVWLLIYPVILLHGRLLLAAFALGTGFMLATLLLVLWATLSGSIMRAFHFRKLRKQLVSGNGINHKKNWQKKSRFFHISTLLFLLFVLMWTGALLHIWRDNVMAVNEQALTNYAGELPFATIADLAPEGTFRLNDLKYSNTVTVSSDWLAPTIITLHENATVTLPDGRYVQGGLYIDYYETAAPWLAREAAREYWVTDKHASYYEALQLPDLGVDCALAYNATLPTLILQEGNRVMRVMFYQTSDSDALSLGDWGKIFADSIKN
ncbi:MAG: DUF2812 domain-containing protein [Oscillospiraceae bacterium]